MSDAYFSSVVLLLHLDGADGATTFVDSSNAKHTVTPAADAQIDTAQSKYGGASLLLDGTGDYLTTADSDDWNFGAGDYTVECWVRFNALPSAGTGVQLLSQWENVSGNQRAWSLNCYNNSGTYQLRWIYTTDGSTGVTHAETWSGLTTGVWYHVAATRTAGTGHLWVDAAELGTGASDSATYFASTAALLIGALTPSSPSQFVNGWIDEVRITKGVARTIVASGPFFGPELVGATSSEAHQSPSVVLKNLYCPPVSQVNQSPGVVVTRSQSLTAGTSDTQVNQSTGGNVGIVSSITIGIDTRDWGTSGIGITINPYRSGTSSITIGIGPYTGTSTITITINPKRSGTTTIPIGIYGDLTAEAAAQAVTWRPKCVLNGVDISGKLVGAIEIESEEMSAPVASFSFLPAAGTVDPLAWVGTTVVLSWQRYVSGVLSGERVRFTGIVSDPAWDADNRLIAISATGDLQSILDGMDKTSIAAMITNGQWSDTVFGEPGDMGGWDYCEALLSTCDDIVWQDASGAIRVSSTVAKASPDFTFEDSGRFEGSLQLDYASRMDFVTQALYTFEHRFKRRRQRNYSFIWMPLELATPCHYLTGGYELPQRTMVESAANGGGLTVLGDISYRPVWPGSSYLCALGNPVTGESNYGHIMFVNNPVVTDLLCTGAQWRAGRRWMQTVTETITLTVNASESQATIGVLPVEETFTVESEADDPTWESSLEYTGYEGTAVVMSNGVDRRSDLDVESRVILDAAQEVALAKARAEIRKSHRGTSVTFQTVYQPMLDLSHTVEVDCAALACQGKVRRIRDRWDIDTGDCSSEITVALHRHNGSGLTSDDTLEAADKPADPTETVPSTRVYLGFHIGGQADSVLYDETWDGFITNWRDDGSRFDRMRSNPLVAARVYPESFTVVPPDIDEEYTDPADVTADETFEVTIPEDNLVLTSY